MTASLRRIVTCFACVVLILPLLHQPSSGAPFGSCGFNPICALAKSGTEGATKGLSELFERLAPELIQKISFSIDHNILTAEQAAARLLELGNKMAAQTIKDVDARMTKQIDRVKADISELERQIFMDANRFMRENWEQLDCVIDGTQARAGLILKQMKEEFSSLIGRLPFTKEHVDILEKACFKQLDLPSAHGLISSFYAWRCLRLAQLSLNSNTLSIQIAYMDVETKAKSNVCVLKNDPIALPMATEIWVTEGIRAMTWLRVRQH